MSTTLFEAGIRRKEEERRRPSQVSGVVINNCDLLKKGRVLVRIPSLGEEVWARVGSTGAGSSRGIMDIPQRDDEVIVAFVNDDPDDAVVVGSLWNNLDQPPADSPTDLLVKRVIRTGLADGAGHEVEFDDALQSITITSSTRQKIVLDPGKIELSNGAGTVKITMDSVQQSITISAANALELSAQQIKISGSKVEIQGTAAASLTSSGDCTIRGLKVGIN
jgi:uncharacterized protein involved in type VI secretion and phage assembly